MVGINEDVENGTGFEERKKVFFPPCLIVLSGLPLTGKTVLAEKLVSFSNLEMVDVDMVRDGIDELRKKDGQVRMLEPEEEKAVMIRSYAEACQRAENMISKGVPVVISGTFSRAEFKQPLEKLINFLRERGIPLKAFLLTAADKEILKRIKKRKESGSFSNIDSLERYRWAKGIFSRIEFAPITEIDTSKPSWIEQVLEDLKDLEVNE